MIHVLLSITPSPKKQSYLKDKPLKKRFGIITLFYCHTQSLCNSCPPAKWSVCFLLTKHFLFLMLVPILSAPKEPSNTSVSQEPCAVVCCPYFVSWNQNKLGGAYNIRTGIIIILVRLLNQCEFSLVCSVFI